VACRAERRFCGFDDGTMLGRSFPDRDITHHFDGKPEPMQIPNVIPGEGRLTPYLSLRRDDIQSKC
jgi:hypothetical protein